MSRKSFRDSFRINRLGTLVGLLAMVLSFAALAAAQSQPYPTYSPGENTSASTGPTYSAPLSNPWVVSDGAIITPAGTQVYLGITTRAKDIALNPNTKTHTAAVLQMSAPQSVTIFNTQTGAILQTYSPPYLSGTTTKYDSDGSGKGIAYTPDGLHLLFSQDGYSSAYKSGNAYVTIANVDPNSGLITSTGGTNPFPNQVAVPIDIDSQNYLTQVTCPPNSPGGTTGSIDIPCGQTVSIVSDNTFTSYPLGLAVSPDGRTAYAVLDNNDTLTKIDLTAATPVEGTEIRVGNVPNSVVISPDGKTAYVSNEAGRVATANDYLGYSNGTPVVAVNPTGATATGTVSVVDLASFTVTGTISTGLHPTGMAFWGKYLLVANAYSDSLSVIDTTINKVVQTVSLGLPIGVPGQGQPAYGAGPNSIAVDSKHGIAYIALYNANAIGVIDLNFLVSNPLMGMIPVGYAPGSVVLDTVDNVLLVANDKGIGTTGFGVVPPPTSSPENSYNHYYGVYDFNTHEDLGTVSIVPVPNLLTLAEMTVQVFENNHWDLWQNILSASGGNRSAKPVAIPAKIGDPSLIQHVFVIIRENRTYDQILGDVVGGNGDASLAVFGDNSMYQEYPEVTPNAHALVQRFPLLDNFYDPSRQSADGHNWITQAMAPYSDDIQSPDWLRDYPSNGGEALAYQKNGHLWDQAAKAGVSFKNYGEYIEYNTFTVAGCSPSDVVGGYEPGQTLPFNASNHCEPNWVQFYQDSQCFEGGPDCGPPGTPGETTLYYQNAIGSVSPLPNLINHTVQNYPQFDLGIPDQYRFDVWQQDFNKDVAAGTVPQLEFMWISSDHTGGPPDATAMEADNDLALGRFVDAISHSPIWSSSAIFVEEDDAQNGVDHVDGHRSPGYVISPYVTQQVNPDGTGAGVTEVSTFYTQVNMTRTIEQILGLTPMNQNDLVASPMTPLFVNNPPAVNFLPWSHVGNGVPLCYGVEITTSSPSTCNLFTTLATARPAVKHQKDSPAVMALRAGWLQKKAEIFAGKYHTPDSEDIDTVSHYDWYEATGFKVPFPGEKTVRPPSDFNRPAPAKADLDD
jgi:YVTN family beta-propeller protein